MWDDEQVDAAIDDTARQMTSGEPSGDFRVRVMARIGGRRRVTISWRPVVAAIALAAVLIVVVRVVRQPEKPNPTQRREPGAVASVRLKPDPTYELKPGFAVQGKPEPEEVRLPKSTGVAQGFGPAIAGPKACATTECVEPLATPPLELDSIAVGALAAGDAIHIDPLPPVPSIALTPLDVEHESE